MKEHIKTNQKQLQELQEEKQQSLQLQIELAHTKGELKGIERSLVISPVPSVSNINVNQGHLFLVIKLDDVNFSHKLIYYSIRRRSWVKNAHGNSS